MTGRELGLALVYYAVVGSVAACAAIVAAIPFDGLPRIVAVVDAVIVSRWVTTLLIDRAAAWVKGGRS